jgi:tripartite-type tricarboxylate transporter receptor subunit TctC
MFKQIAGVDMVHVPYRGAGPAIQDLIAGNVQVMFDSLASSAQHVRDGRLRALAVSTAQRLPAFPDLPTIAEAGVAGYEISTWYGIWGPRGLPDTVATRLHGQIARATATEEARARFTAMGADVVASTPADFARFTRAEFERFGRLIRDANIQAE